jgi:hypothetical protein
MDRWVTQKNIEALKQRLGDGRIHENEAELRRQLAEQEALLRGINESPGAPERPSGRAPGAWGASRTDR